MFLTPRKGGFCFMPIRKVVKKEPVKSAQNAAKNVRILTKRRSYVLFV